MRGYVTLINPLHAPARFLWQSSGVQNPFTICPKTGIVEPFSSLNCEVVFYLHLNNTSMEGRFQLQLLRVDEKHAGTSPSAINDLSGHHKDIELLCRAKLLPSKLSFSTRRLPLGSLAHGLPCTRQITIFNLGQNSVLFNINKESKNVNINGDITSYMHRLSGALPAKVDMQVDPSEGEIPVSGEITLKVTCVPIGLGKFESSMVLSTYDGQNIDLSVCGTVLKPEIELISNLYEFGGVRVGSMKSLPLGIINHGITRVLIEIDLKSYDEFQISDCVNSFSADEYMNERINTNETKVSTRSQLSNLSNCDQLEKHSMISIANPHSHSYLEFDSESNVYHIFVSPRTKWVGSIIYKPKVVSFHDFTLPLVINKLHPKLISQKFGQTNSDQERPASETEANSKLITEEYEAQVLATGLRQPIEIEPKSGVLKFTTTLDETASELGNILYQHLSIKSLIDLPMKWHLAVHKIQRFNKRGQGRLAIRDVNGTELLPDLDGYINGAFMDSNDKTVHLEIQLCPVQAGCFKLNLPIWLTYSETFDDEQSPKSNYTHYKTLQIHIELKKLEIKFEPKRILIPPVPTGVNVRIPVTLTAYQLNKPIRIIGFWNFSPAYEVQPPLCEANIQCPFTVEYLEGQILKPETSSSGCNTGSLNIQVNFNSTINGLVLAPNPRPLCLIIIAYLVSCDTDGIKHCPNRDSLSSLYICSAALPVSAAVDNSLISWFDYITRRPNEFRLNYSQDPGLINSRMKEMKYTSNLNISTIYKLFDEIKFSQKEFLDTEDTSSDRTSNLGSNVRQQSVGKCTYGLTDSNNNIRDIASSPITGINPSGNLEDSDQPRSSPSTTATRRTNWYGSCIFLPDWQLIDRAATEQVQRWLCVHGFPVGRYPLKFPDDFRNCISLTATISDISIMGDKQKSNPKFTQNALPNESNQSVSLRRNNNQPSETVSRSLNPLYNCLQHLCCNKQPPGLLPSINLPIDNPYEALSTVYFYCSALLTFARSQGSCLPHILPEHLMEPNDYRLWYKYGCPGLTESARTVCTSMSQSLNTIPTTDFEKPQAANYGSKQNNYDSIKIDLCLLSESTVERFLIISERAWTDLMLQIIKCLLFNRITTSSLDLITLPPKVLRLNQTCSLSSTSSSASCPHQNESSRSDQVVAHAVRLPAKNNSIQKSKPTHLNDTQVNSCYSPCERILLAWLNYCYHQYACQIWPERKSVFKDSWIVTNFDNDLRDGIVLASTIGAYIPSLIPNYLSKMYTQPTSNEQCFHNAIIVVQALRVIRFEYDLYPSDLTSPHPFGMSLLCLHLSCQLPDYLPKQTIHFTGLLNSTTKRQLVITNTSSHTLTYYCVIIGPNAIDFTCTLSGNLNKSTKRENNKVHTNRNEAKKSKRSADYNVTVNNSNEQLCNNVKEMRITISPKGKIQLCIEYKSRFLKPTEAIFLAVSQRQNTFQGKNLSFLLSGSVGGLEMLPVKVVKSPCYQMTEFKLPVINPYKLDGIFQITVIESRSDLFNSLCQVQGLNTITKESHSENILASETYSVTERSSFDQSSENSQLPPEILKEYYQRTQYQSFYCRELTIQLSGNVNNTSTNLYPIKQSTSEDSKVQQKYDSYIRNLSEVSIVYLPLGWGTRECCLLLSNDKIGEFVMLLKGIAQLPQPSLLPFSDFQNDLNTEKSPTQKKEDIVLDLQLQQHLLAVQVIQMLYTYDVP
ncbi:unnamed protein product [Heterobilharzia americana]|nr:unnamed protein product [Heterobilharzia americana]